MNPLPVPTLPRPSRQQGFTLVELSIVLVIIGLVVGAVLVGRDMAKAAEVRAVIRQIESYRAAVNAFKGKYNCLPGDCVNAVAKGLGSSSYPGRNGDGNGKIGPANFAGSCGFNMNPSYGDEEPVNFWYHLQVAGMISESVSGYISSMQTSSNFTNQEIESALPKTKMNNALIAASSFYSCPAPANSVEKGSGFFIFNYQDVNGLLHNIASISPNDLRAIDTKIDDGKPLKGTVSCGPINARVTGWSGGSTCGWGTCDDNAGNYLSSSVPGCNAAFGNLF